MSEITITAIAILGLLVCLIILIKMLDRRPHCFKCGGNLSQAYLIGDSREDLVICDKCETLYREMDGCLFEVFGIPPQLIEGENNH